MNTLLKKYITNIVLVVILLNPVFDLITSLTINVLHINFNFIIIIKMIFMLLLIYYLFTTKSKYKKTYVLMVFIYMLIYILNQGINMLEIQYLFRSFYFPINLVCLLQIYENNELNIKTNHLVNILLMYIILILIPIITNTNFNSYAYSKEGTVGWFNAANEIGAILSILLPFLFVKLKKQFYLIPIILYIYFSIGTKVPVLSLMIVITIFLIKYIIKIIKERQIKKIIAILIVLLSALTFVIIFIPKTSFYKNIIIHLDFLNVDSIDDLASPYIIDHFVFSERVKFYLDTKEYYDTSTINEKLFGIGYSNQIKTIEMDYYDIFYRNGIIGFIIYFIPLIYVLYIIYKKINKKLYIEYTSIFLILLLALFSGHIFVAPSVSILVAIILIMTINGGLNENSSTNN